MADIRIDNEKTIDLIAGLAAAARDRQSGEQIVLLQSAGLLANTLRGDLVQAEEDARLAAAVERQEQARGFGQAGPLGPVGHADPVGTSSPAGHRTPRCIAKRAAARIRSAPKRKRAKIAGKRKAKR
jgi:hypothetical protein